MPEINLNFRFSSDEAEKFFYCSKRNICWNSGYGAGKTYAACQKALALMLKFPGYRWAIGRFNGTELKRTTMQTFFKVCPPELYDEKFGGKNISSPVPCTQLINGSLIYWMHFDQYDESALRSLEINGAITDQAEEILEQTYLTLDTRVGRWDNVEVPEDLISVLPKNPFTGKPMPPAYNIVLLNPPDEGEFHWAMQRYHPDSQLWQNELRDTHAYFETSSISNKALPPEVLKSMMLGKDQEWIDRYIHGKVMKGAGAIHNISPLSILEPDPAFIKILIQKGALTRVLDHGATSPTACTWWVTYRGNYYCYREYYTPNKVISYHRERIAELSGDEYYVSNYCDPSMFKKQSEKYGGFWTLAQEYADANVDAPTLSWTPADNNEYATRNRINELLAIDPNWEHPVLKTKGSPRIFFIKKTSEYPNGCEHIIRETASQKKELLAEIQGKKIYSDEREKSISDHAYDTLRYFAASHLQSPSEPKRKPAPNSFLAARRRIMALKQMEAMQN